MEIVDEVRQIIATSLSIPVEQLSADSRLEELGAEFLDMIEILFDIEEKFNISIPFKANEGTHVSKPGGDDESAEPQFSTIGDIAAVVKKMVEAKTAR